MYNSQYYTCEQIDQRLLQGYVDDYNTQTGQSLTKEQFLTKLGNIFAKETVIDNTAVNIGYFVCDTAEGTAAKVITAAGYALFQGGSIKVKFLNRNTAGNATLNINSQGAKTLYYGGKPVSASNSWDNDEVVEIYYDGTNYYANNVEGNFKDGIFDISAYNLTEGQPTKYATLAEALGTNGNNIPQSLRKGGMSIKFVQSSDNKYVQYRLMADEFSTTETDWQGVDDEPTAGSNNLVKSGGVAKSLFDLDRKGYFLGKTKDLQASVLQWLFTTDELTPFDLNGPVSISIDELSIDHLKMLYFYRKNLSTGVIEYLNLGSAWQNKIKEGTIIPVIGEGYQLLSLYVKAEDISVACTLKFHLVYSSIKEDVNSLKTITANLEENDTKQDEDITSLQKDLNIQISKEAVLSSASSLSWIFNNEDLLKYNLYGPISIVIDDLSVDHLSDLYFQCVNDEGDIISLNTGSVWTNKIKKGATIPLIYKPDDYKLMNLYVKTVPNDCTIKCHIVYKNKLSDLEEELNSISEELGNDITKLELDVYGTEDNILEKDGTFINGQNSFLLTEDELGNNFVDEVELEVTSLSVQTIDFIQFSYYKKDGTIVNLNTGSSVIVKTGLKVTLFKEEGARLFRVYHSVSQLPEQTVDISIKLTALVGKTGIKENVDNILNHSIYIPKEIIHHNDKDTFIYPKNLIAANHNDKSISICARNKRSNIEYSQIINGDPALKMQLIASDNVLYDLEDIPVKHFTPSAPANDLFILTIGDSLMLGANLSYHGCINNELSRLFNGIGKAIANGDEPLGYSNIHVIGTLESGAEDAPIKHEGRGGWSVGMYLNTQSGNAFYNPSKQKFDLDYYLSQNNFYTEGVDATGSNLIVGIMLNWNSDPFEKVWRLNYIELIENIHASHPNARILLIGCNGPCEIVYQTHINYLGSAPIQANTKKRVIEYEKIIAELAETYSYCYHCPILPYFYPEEAYRQYELSYVPRNPTKKIKVYADSTHPTYMGYGQFADIICKYICYYFLS